MPLTRRYFLGALAGLGTLPWWTVARALTTGEIPLGPSQPFSFQHLIQEARKRAAQVFHPVPPRSSALLDRIDYDTYQKIQFRHERALWAETEAPYPIEFFHLGKYAKQPVAIYVVEGEQARKVAYSPSFFDYNDIPFRQKIPTDLGFAGFRVMNQGEPKTDWLVFQGASYFRSAGALNQYGLSARGIAINTALPSHREEFPRFTAFWLERPQPNSRTLRIYALLDGPSITGAYRFDCRNEGKVIQDVHAELFQRKDVERLGIAPLTSMYWYSETNDRQGTDWRPEIHDSDGLALWTGAGERIWRPLNNPPSVQTNSFIDNNPKGFGLVQRDRNFDHYQDDSVFYNRRPSLWVEPKEDWGAGMVQLVELPTNDEIYDNIVAYWIPDAPAQKGRHWRINYRLHWVGKAPYPPSSVAYVVATRLGRPGFPGQHEPRDENGRKFVIDFTGGPLSTLEQRYDLDVIVSASSGTVTNAYALKVVGTERWRAAFDLHTVGKAPVNLRCFLRLGNRTLTETWLYQYFPRSWKAC